MEQVRGTGSWLITRLERLDYQKGKERRSPKRNGESTGTALWNNSASTGQSPGSSSEGREHDRGRYMETG